MLQRCLVLGGCLCPLYIVQEFSFFVFDMKVVTAHMGHREESHSPPLLRCPPVVRGNKGNVSISLRNLEAKGLVVVSRTRGGKAEALALTREGKNRSALFIRKF